MERTPVSLYLELEEGKTADLEVVANAAISWSQGIKEIAFVIDPSFELKVELASGTEGSLSLNAILTAIKKTANKHPKMSTVLIATFTWFALETGSYTYGNILDYIMSDDAPPEVQTMSEAEKEAMAKDVEKRVQQQLAVRHKKQVFEELERDPAIKGAGISSKPGKKPRVIVPRSEFLSRAGADSLIIEEDVKRRTRIETTTATLISPILKDAERRWKFQVGKDPEFSATMRDHEFLEGMRLKDIEIPLGLGVEMTFDMEIKEEFEGEVWVVVERNITKVISPKRRKVDLFAPNR